MRRSRAGPRRRAPSRGSSSGRSPSLPQPGRTAVRRAMDEGPHQLMLSAGPVSGVTGAHALPMRTHDSPFDAKCSAGPVASGQRVPATSIASSFPRISGSRNVDPSRETSASVGSAARPVPTGAPIRACVAEIGSPRPLANTTMAPAPIPTAVRNLADAVAATGTRPGPLAGSGLAILLARGLVDALSRSHASAPPPISSPP